MDVVFSISWTSGSEIKIILSDHLFFSKSSSHTFVVPRWAKKTWIKLLLVSACSSTWKSSISCHKHKKEIQEGYFMLGSFFYLRKNSCLRNTTFWSPARGPETTPVSTTSMQTSGCLRFGACFRTWALANLNISLASARDSNLLVLWRLIIHGFLLSEISRAHLRAALINSSGGTMASTSPSEKASSPLTGLDVCSSVASLDKLRETGTEISKRYEWPLKLFYSKVSKINHQHHF